MPKIPDKLLEGLEEIETARQDSNQPSFTATIFSGKPQFNLIMPFPEQSSEDKAAGDALEQKVKEQFLKPDVLDPEELARTGQIPETAFQKAFELGLFGMKIPKEYGGLGLTQTNYSRILALIASYCDLFALTLSAHQSIGLPQPLLILSNDPAIKKTLTPELIARNEAQKQRFLPSLAKNKISAFAFTEQLVGSDPASMTLEARLNRQGTHFAITNHKLYITNINIADVFVVMARVPFTEKKDEKTGKFVFDSRGKKILVPARPDDAVAKNEKGKEIKEITSFIVEKNRPGVKVIQKCEFEAAKGLDNGLIIFDNVLVPEENVIGQVGKGLRYALTILNTGRVSINPICLGLSRQAWLPTLEWVKSRKTFGKALGEHQIQTIRIARMASTLFAMEAASLLSSQLVDRKNTDVRIEAALTKVFCSEGALEFLRNSEILFGARGYETADSRKTRNRLDFPGKNFTEPTIPVGRLYMNADLYRIGEGATDILTSFFAREGLNALIAKLESFFEEKGLRKLFKFARLGIDYAFWYFSNCFGQTIKIEHPRVRKHLRYVERASRRLARNIFYILCANAPEAILGKITPQELRDSQGLTSDIANTAKNLFMITATALYAEYQERVYNRTEAWDLAEQFLLDAKHSIEGDSTFNRIAKNMRIKNRENFYAKTIQIGLKALKGNYNWLAGGAPDGAAEK